MISKKIIHTEAAPQAIGTYSQAVQAGNMLFISGQIPLDPKTMECVSTQINLQIEQTFKNLGEILKAAGGNFSSIIKLNIFLTDLSNFPLVNEAMTRYFSEPYPARAVIGVSALPKNVNVEIDAIAIVE